MRRLEAAVGLEGFGHLARERGLVTRIAEQINAPRGELTDKIAALLDRLKAVERDNARLKAQATAARAAELAASAEPADGTTVVEGSPDEARALALAVRDHLRRKSSAGGRGVCRCPGARAQPGRHHHRA